MKRHFQNHSRLENPKTGAETVQKWCSFLHVEAEVHPEMESAIVTAFCRRTPKPVGYSNMPDHLRSVMVARGNSWSKAVEQKDTT